MPRRTIAYLDTPTLDGRIIRTLTWPDAPIPLLFGTVTLGPQLLGWVTDPRTHPRDLHHPPRVTADLSVVVPGLGPEIDLDTTGDPGVDPEGRLIWTTARLSAVTLGPRPAWEGMIE